MAVAVAPRSRRHPRLRCPRRESGTRATRMGRSRTHCLVRRIGPGGSCPHCGRASRVRGPHRRRPEHPHPTTLKMNTTTNLPTTPNCGLKPSRIRREESETPQTSPANSPNHSAHYSATSSNKQPDDAPKSTSSTPRPNQRRRHPTHPELALAGATRSSGTPSTMRRALGLKEKTMVGDTGLEPVTSAV